MKKFSVFTALLVLAIFLAFPVVKTSLLLAETMPPEPAPYQMTAETLPPEPSTLLAETLPPTPSTTFIQTLETQPPTP